MTDEQQEVVIDFAIEAFWHSVAAQCPHIKTGDLDMDTDLAFRAVATMAVTCWLEANQPGPDVLVLRGGSLFADQFPYFPALEFKPAELPVPLPYDQSYRNDQCPTFTNDPECDNTPGSLVLFTDHPDPQKRRDRGATRFMLIRNIVEDTELLLECETLEELERFLKAHG